MRRWLKSLLFSGGYVLLLVFWAGLIAHRSYKPVWFGRYSTWYLVGLVGLSALVLLWKPIFEFLARESCVRWRGRQVLCRASTKWIVLATALLLGAAVLEWRMRRAQPWVRSPDPALVRQFHPFLQNEWVAGDATLHVNSDSFRGDPLTPGSYDVLIVMLGGSTIFSHDVPYEQSHPVLLQNLLCEQYPGLRILVQNAGNEYHTTLHSLIKYATRIRKHRPHIIIMWHGINDLCRSFGPNWFTLEDAPYNDDYRHYLGPVAGILRYYATPVPTPKLIHSALLSWLSEALYSDVRAAWQARTRERSLAPMRVNEFPSLRAFENNLDSLLRLMIADGVRVVMASEPSMYGAMDALELQTNFWMQKSLCRSGDRYPDVESLRIGMNAFNAASRDLAQRHNGLFFDLDAALPKEPQYMFDDCHYTVEGNKRVAEMVADFLIRHKVVDAVLVQPSNAVSVAPPQTATRHAGDLTGNSNSTWNKTIPEGELRAGQVGATNIFQE